MDGEKCRLGRGVSLDKAEGGFLGVSTYSYDINVYTFSVPGGVNLTPGTTYWLELQNAVVTLGDPAFGDENDGPSKAWDSMSGYLQVGAGTCVVLVGYCSESFAIDAVPEPSAMALGGSGLLLLAAALRGRRKR